MTRDEQLKAIREKCIAVNPEIAALPPYPYNPDAAKAIVSLERYTGKTLWNGDMEASATMMIENYRQQQAGDYRAMLEGRYQGRPIRLADILLAMKYDEVISRHGVFGREHHGDVIWIASARWNLREDDLNQQSDACIAFLADLLV